MSTGRAAREKVDRKRYRVDQHPIDDALAELEADTERESTAQSPRKKRKHAKVDVGRPDEQIRAPSSRPLGLIKRGNLAAHFQRSVEVPNVDETEAGSSVVGNSGTTET